MRKRLLAFLIICASTILLTIGLSNTFPVTAQPLAQQSTTTATYLPTVTGTPVGVVVTVTEEEAHINVRSGPGSTYPVVGVLLAGQEVPAKGRSEGGDWVLVEYLGIEGNEGWVYSYLLTIPTGSYLPIVEPPATPTPVMTATIDQTLAAQFLITVAPTRLPTYTEPAPLSIPTLPSDETTSPTGFIPMGLVIITVATIGIFLGLVSIIRGK